MAKAKKVKEPDPERFYVQESEVKGMFLELVGHVGGTARTIELDLDEDPARELLTTLEDYIATHFDAE